MGGAVSRNGSRIGNVIRALKQKWGPPVVKQTMWDSEYESGKWEHCSETPNAYIYEFVERYCRGGSILDLGCGSGNTGNEIDVAKYRFYTGIDISAVAVQKANIRSGKCARSQRNRYIQGSIESYVPSTTYDVILFRESIYYIPHTRIKPALDRYRCHLEQSSGVFIVNVSATGSRHYMEIVRFLETNYDVVEKCGFQGEDAIVLVFR